MDGGGGGGNKSFRLSHCTVSAVEAKLLEYGALIRERRRDGKKDMPQQPTNMVDRRPEQVRKARPCPQWSNWLGRGGSQAIL